MSSPGAGPSRSSASGLPPAPNVPDVGQIRQSEPEAVGASSSTHHQPEPELKRKTRIYRFWKRKPRDNGKSDQKDSSGGRFGQWLRRTIVKLSGKKRPQVPLDEATEESGLLFDQAFKTAAEYDTTGNLAQLEAAIQFYRRVLELAPPEDRVRVRITNNLANRLQARYHKTGETKDLAEAIDLHQVALELRPPGHPARDSALSNLAICLQDRYHRTGDMNDLTAAIRFHEEALTLRPEGHPQRNSTLNNLALCLHDRCSRTGCIADLDIAVTYGQDALELCPPNHPERHISLHNLAYCLRDSFKRLGEMGDLIEAIGWLQEALKFRCPGHPLRDTSLNDLANCLQDHYHHAGKSEDLETAIELHKENLSLRPRGHPKRSESLSKLATCLSIQLGQDKAQQCSAGVVAIIDMLREATIPSPASIPDRIDAANTWRTLAHKYSHPSELEAAKETLKLLDLAISESTSVEGLSSRLSEDLRFCYAQGVASDAAALTLQDDDVVLAVSLLEQGRSSIFTHLGRYRSAIDDVRSASRELASRFHKLSAELDALVLCTGSAGPHGNTPIGIFEDNGTRHYRIQTEWTKTVEAIRSLPGLESFLLPPPFHQLQQAAEQGPVIIVNVNDRRSDAIIVISSGDSVLVPLPNVDPKIVHKLIERLGKRPAECSPAVAVDILREIWRIIVGPVVAQLRNAPIKLSLRSRIWWCPIGAASRLPLHAAGPYTRSDPNLATLFISSYTPTLIGALIRARQSKLAGPKPEAPIQRILVVGQSDTPNERPLPKVQEEIRAIMQLAPHAAILDSCEATREAVLKGIQEYAWLHLACHGHHHPKQPFRSHFSMHDGPISLLDLIAKDLPQAELAVLSACHSARVCEILPDESLHPAAGMMFAGFKSVIGTMWAFDDGLGSPLAGEFYKLMVDGKKDYTDAAVALVDAFREVMKRDRNAVSFMQWINVVHFGV